jgi:peroxiredoxin
MGLRGLLSAAGIAAATLTGCSSGTAAPATPERAPSTAELTWPPQLGEPYPDLRLKDPDGRPVALSSFKGKVILVEPIGMSCPACQAFAGANRAQPGPFADVRPQDGLQSIEEYVERYAGGVRLDDPRLVHVQLLLYDLRAAGAPTLEQARRWAAHFAPDGDGAPVVLVGDERLIGRASYEMIPGFQLIDRDFVLRVDSTGHEPRHDLWTELLPQLGRLLAEVDAPRPAGQARVGRPMADFALNDTAGQARTLAELRGGKPALLYFYSGCCGHCADELPKILAPAREFERRGAAVVGVQYFGDSASCQRKRVEFELPGTVLADATGEVCGMFGVGDFTVFTLDAAGVIRYRGPVDGLPEA